MPDKKFSLANDAKGNRDKAAVEKAITKIARPAEGETIAYHQPVSAPTPSTPGRETTHTLPSNYAPALPSTQIDTNCVRPMTRTTTSRRAFVFSSSVGTICAAVLSMK